MTIDTAQRPPKQTPSDRLVLMFEEAIDSGRWKPGERIPTERALSDHYGVAPNTMRRALQQLEAAGRIIRHVGRGTFVEEGKRTQPNDLARRIENASPTEIMEV